MTTATATTMTKSVDLQVHYEPDVDAFAVCYGAAQRTIGHVQQEMNGTWSASARNADHTSGGHGSRSIAVHHVLATFLNVAASA